MAKAALVIMAIVLLAFQGAAAFAGTVAVIVNSSNQHKSMSVDEIRRIYSN